MKTDDILSMALIAASFLIMAATLWNLSGKVRRGIEAVETAHLWARRKRKRAVARLARLALDATEHYNHWSARKRRKLETLQWQFYKEWRGI